MSQSEPVRTIPWKPIERLRDDEIPKNGLLGALDALHTEWKGRMEVLSEDERRAVRKRSQRRLAVETGILERLYDVEWGLTLTLVAEGFGREVIERAGGDVDDRTLATIRAQMDSIEMVLDFVHEDRPLSPSFIKELHQAITRTQDTYIVTDSLGRLVETSLPKGEWKRQPNHVVRADGTMLEYAPPEHVASEIDRIVEMWKELENRTVHPVVEAAWLHHRFVQTHPFADGNGRVARVLTLLVLEKHLYPPLVIDRWHRKDYLDALESANNCDLGPLIRLFAKLENAAIVGELERPANWAERGVSDDVAHTLADQLLAIKKRNVTDIRNKLQPRAIALSGRIEAWFERKQSTLKEVFESKGIKVAAFADHGKRPNERASWFRRQIVDSAHRTGHYADFGGYVSWSRLRIEIEDLLIDYVASLHGAGREPGVMAVTTFGEIEFKRPSGDADQQIPARETIVTTRDAFSFVHSETQEGIERRSSGLEELLDEGLATALLEILKRI